MRTKNKVFTLTTLTFLISVFSNSAFAELSFTAIGRCTNISMGDYKLSVSEHAALITTPSGETVPVRQYYSRIYEYIPISTKPQDARITILHRSLECLESNDGCAGLIRDGGRGCSAKFFAMPEAAE